MLKTVTELKGATIAATDGDIGSVKDVYFDDVVWTIRYLVVDTGTWLPGRQVLISPMSVRGSAWGDQVPVALTREQVENSPPIEADQPVNRQYEAALSRHYGYPYYWEGAGRWGAVAYPDVVRPIPTSPAAQEALARDLATDDRTLRSASDVMTYYIGATDGDLGHVEGFLVDDRGWAIRYMIVDTRNWWPGRKVLISPTWIKEVSWPASKVHVDLSREKIKSAPEYDPSRPLERDDETRLFGHHERPAYWE